MKERLILVMFLCMAISSYGQLIEDPQGDYEVPSLVPQTPDVASLLKFTETSMSTHTGVPDISIPLMSLKSRSLSANVTVSYHAGGHRVTEESSWAGLGWNVSAGGKIVRTVNGYPDDRKNTGYIYNFYTAEHVASACANGFTPVQDQYGNTCEYYLGGDAQESQIDYEPDAFNFSMFGQSGSFMFNQDRTTSSTGEIIQFPLGNYKIVPTFNNNNIGDIISWDITDAQGIIYHFEKGNFFHNGLSFNQKAGASSDLPVSMGSSYTETWDLTRVSTPEGDEITLTYTRPANFPNPNTVQNEEVSAMGTESLIVYDLSQQPGPLQQPNLRITNYSHIERSYTVLDSIKSDLGFIRFIRSSANRQDTQTAKKRLQYIEMRDNSNTLINKVELIHDYFTSSTQGLNNEFMYGFNNQSSTNTFLSKRMYLKELKFWNKNENDSYSYDFNYNTSVKLPHRRSKAQDHWGYFNGAIGNGSLIPHISSASNREVSPAHSNAFILEEIRYPEGGVTKFEYENNRGDSRFTNGPAYIQKRSQLSATLNNQHDITPSGLFTIYEFEKDISIPSTAKSDPLNLSNTQVEVSGYSTRCLEGVAIYPEEDLVCTRMFLKIYKLNAFGQEEPNPVVRNIWDNGVVSLEKGRDYRYKIEISIHNGDYNFNDHYSEVELKWMEENPNPVVEQFSYFGGLRIKNIKTFDNEGLALHRSYEYEGGYIVSEPTYYSVSPAGVHKYVSQSWVPLETTQQSYTGYKTVREIFHDARALLDEVGVSDKQSALGATDLVNNVLDPSDLDVIDVVISDGTMDTGTSIRKKYIVERTFNTATGNYNFAQAPYMQEWASGVLLSENMANKKMVINEIDTYFDFNNEKAHGIVFSRDCKEDPRQITSLLYASTCDILTDPTEQYSYTLYPGIKIPIGIKELLIERELTTEKVTSMYYDSAHNHYYPTKITSTDSEGRTVEVHKRYPYEVGELALLSENRVSTELETDFIRGGRILSKVKKSYINASGSRLLGSVNAAKVDLPVGSTAPVTFEERLTYHEYDSKGNVQEVSKTNGTHIVYIWGHQGSLLVAKVENATLADVESLMFFGPNFVINGALSPAQDSMLRSLPGALVTTFTHEPLVGVTSIKDPRGYTTHYEYDSFNRLRFIKDEDGNIVSENNYNYKN